MDLRAVEQAIAASPLAALYQRTVALPKLLRLAHPPLEGPVLEIGCGAGATSEGILQKFPKVDLTATDSDPALLERARRRLGDRARVLEGHPTLLQYADGHFASVLELHALHHVPDYPQALREIHRVLGARGQFLFMDITENAFRGLRGRLFPPGAGFSKAWFRSALEEAGFTVEVLVGNWVILGRAVKTRETSRAEEVPEEILDLMGAPRGGY